ncbi:MAG TPA: hypothetical protein VF412_12585 [Bdellovibrio sp.]|uniref:hypothetical protein n=1 Tax=Bdellovibrio sp. TaxID=28201 RepID=UPI002F04580C
MKDKTKNSLVEFYFGTLEESQRLQIEKNLLLDPEMLLDYLDIKREIEDAELIPQQPSAFLWRRMQPLAKKKSFYLTIAAGLVAATLACFYFIHTASVKNNSFVNDDGILFDSGAEHSVTSDVL